MEIPLVTHGGPPYHFFSGTEKKDDHSARGRKNVKTRDVHNGKNEGGMAKKDPSAGFDMLNVAVKRKKYHHKLRITARTAEDISGAM